MKMKGSLLLVGVSTLVVVAYWRWGWPGVALAAGALVLWLLLHFNRLMHVIRRAADRPMGYVDSAVMLHAKLRPGRTLLHVTALTHSLGERLESADEALERYRWRDGSQASVTCEFRDGKLRTWQLDRPADAAH